MRHTPSGDSGCVAVDHESDRVVATRKSSRPVRVQASVAVVLAFSAGFLKQSLATLLGRGRIVIGSNRCFVPEAITDGVNGFLCDYDDIDAWVSRAP
jgi:glycosyltransferase involved in cell wall biosynthesis